VELRILWWTARGSTLATLAACAVLVGPGKPLAAEDPITSREPGETAASSGARVLAIEFEGRERIPEETLLRVIGVRPGDLWDEDRELAALRRLAAYPYLEAVFPPRVARGAAGISLVFPIRERRVIGELGIKGNQAFDGYALLALTGLATGQPFVEVALREGEAAILRHYHEDGFLLASVEADARPAGAGRTDVLFHVREERRVYVSAVTLEGAREVPASEALSVLQLQPRRLLGILSRGYYLPHRIEEDLERLRAFYIERGYLSAEVALDSIAFAPGGESVAVGLRVNEGPRFRIREVRIEGNKLFPTRLLEREAALPAGGPYSGRAIEEAYLRLVRWYDEHSDNVPRIEVEPPKAGAGNDVAIVFKIEEGKRHVETGTVTIHGNEVTRDRVVRRDVALLPGQHLTRAETRKTLETLEKRGYYEGVEIKLGEPTLDPARPAVEVRDVDIYIQEKEKMRMFHAGGGSSSGSGAFGILRLDHPNFDLFRLPRAWDDWRGAFTGGGQHLQVEVLPGSRESFYQFRFLEPYFFRSDLQFGLSGGTSFYERETYDETRFRGKLELRKLFDREGRFTGSLGWVADLVEIDDLDAAAPTDVLAAEGKTRLLYPSLDLRYDDRDLNFYSGSVGFLAETGFDIGGGATGSELDFARWTAAAGLSLGLFDRRPDYRHVLSLGARAGFLDGMGGDEVPLFERFYLGGPRTFRGFEYRRLGPHQGEEPVGGEAYFAGTLMYSLPLFWRELRAFALLDVGDLEPELGDITGHRFRIAAGGGLMVRLRILGQVLPANFYWTPAIAREDEDETEVFSFTLQAEF
jgi:outer membrane protein insertion porin family